MNNAITVRDLLPSFWRVPTFGDWPGIVLLATVLILTAAGCWAPTPTLAQEGGPQQGGPAAASDRAGTTAPPSADQSLFPDSLAQRIEVQAEAVERLRKAIFRLQNNDQALDEQGAEVELLASRLRATKRVLRPLLTEIDSQIAQLGPKPKADTIEAPELAKERARLENVRLQVIAAQRRTDLSLFRAEQLHEQIQNYHLQNFTKHILKRSASPLSLVLWQELSQSMPRVTKQLVTVAENWWAAAKVHFGLLPIMLSLAALMYAGLLLVRQRILARVLVEPSKPRPGFLRRVLTTSWLVPFIALPGAGVALLMFATGDLLGIWTGTIKAFVNSGLIAFLLFSLITALSTGLLQPRHPSWRLVAIPNGAARRLLWTTHLIAVVYSVDYFLHHSIRIFQMPVALRVIETSIANLALACLLLVIAFTGLPDNISRISGRLVKSIFRWLRVPLILVAAMIIVATLLGYVALGRFLAGQVMLMGAGGVAVLLAHLAIRALTAQPEGLAEPIESLVDQTGLLSARRRQQFATVLGVVLNLLLGLTVIVLLLLSWGIPTSQLIDGFKALFFGFEIGQFRISPFRILIGVGLFIAVLFVTRLFQRWLDRSVLTTSKVDRGIANSLHTGVGYVGLGIAALIGISYAGIDLSQLTLVIGALSLGVGLGLQSIVNNFVSGLILLVERPVKVGDWVVIGDQQGYVRKISVRATEIETFDRASVIIPNSELISGTVQNWTHRSAMGRVVVRVGVSYDSDPELVRNVLLQIAKETDGILGFPEPSVAFEDFGASSLDFSLRCFISDVNRVLSARTALRFEIYRRFKAHGIEIPFPQQDVHLRDLDTVRGFIAKMQEQRAGEDRAQTIDEAAQSDKDD